MTALKNSKQAEGLPDTTMPPTPPRTKLRYFTPLTPNVKATSNSKDHTAKPTRPTALNQAPRSNFNATP
jgi:hypothetical protein